MMPNKVVYSKQFSKHFAKRILNNESLEKSFVKAVELFLKDRNLSQLHNHKLRGSKKGLRAFSITGDMRIIYREYEQYYLFVDIGTHNQVY